MSQKNDVNCIDTLEMKALLSKCSPINIARQNHSGCALGDSLYIFGGFCMSDKLNSIEQMRNVQKYVQQVGEATPWKLLDIPEYYLPSQRFNAIVAPLDETKILILGGRDNARWRGLKANAFVFDTTQDLSTCISRV